MNAQRRREEIWEIIRKESRAVTASALASRFDVSRQIIVGDVALLRASGCDIISTRDGYICPQIANVGRYIGKLACRHNQPETQAELYTIVDLGGQVLDVVVEHDLYGELTGLLGICCRRDVDLFVERATASSSMLLSQLTGGVHLHTVSCPDRATFEGIKSALGKQGLLYPEG